MSGHLTIGAVRARPGLALAIALACVVAPAVGQTPVVGQTPAVGGSTPAISYPPSRSLGDVAAWLQSDTPLSLVQVVDVSPSAVTAVITASPMGETRGFVASIASEALDPAMFARDGIASWSIPVEVDCARRMARLGAMTGYPGRDLKTDPRNVRKADTSWVNPVATAPLGSLIRALCDRDFTRPLSGHGKMVTRPDPTKAPVRPPPATIFPPGAAPTVEAAAAPAAPSKPPKARMKPPAGGGAFIVQIGASPSLTDSQNLLIRFKKKFGADLGGLTTSVATAQVAGKTVNRALLTGFASPAEANAFCKALAAAKQACFVRR